MPTTEPSEAPKRPGAVEPHDRLFRKTFARTDQGEALLRAALPCSLVELVRWRTLAPAPVDFFDARLRHDRADLLFLAELKSGQGRIYLLLEHKSGAGRMSILQPLRYSDAIARRHVALHPDLPDAPVVPIVVYHGKRPWRFGMGRARAGARVRAPASARPSRNQRVAKGAARRLGRAVVSRKP